MKPNRFGAAVSLSGCGCPAAFGLRQRREHDRHRRNDAGGGTAGDSAAKVDCAGKKALKASGSSAQANAVTRFVTAYESACSGYTLNYTSSGSGAGVSEFTRRANRFRWHRFTAERREGRGREGQGALRRRRRVEPADGVRSDRGHVQRAWRRRRGSRRSHPGQDLQRQRSPRGTRPRSRRSTRARPCPATRSTWSSAAMSPAPRTTSRSTSTRRPTEPGARAPARPSTAASARAPRATRARPQRSRTPPGSITYNEWSYATKQGLQIADIITVGRS